MYRREKKPSPTHVCKNCLTRRGRSAGYLCTACFADPAVREKFPPLDKNLGTGVILGGKPATISTSAQPGSEFKILIMIDRLDRGEHLHHPDDKSSKPVRADYV